MIRYAIFVITSLFLLGNELEGKECDPIDKELGVLVRSPKTRSTMYIMAHNNESKTVAESYRACREEWTRIAVVPTSPYFESMIYKSYLPYQTHEFEYVDYIILVPYKIFDRSLLPKYMPVLGFNMINRLLKVARAGDYDVVPFMRDFEEMMPTSVKYHTEGFRIAWDALLREIGFDHYTIEFFYTMKAFYRNAFIIKPNVLKQLMEFMTRAIDISEHNIHVHNLMKIDARYVLGKKEVAMRVFGTPYYQLHPFIFERLPSFFLYASNVSICTGPTTPCKYNYNGTPKGKSVIKKKPAKKQ